MWIGQLKQHVQERGACLEQRAGVRMKCPGDDQVRSVVPEVASKCRGVKQGRSNLWDRRRISLQRMSLAGVGNVVWNTTPIA